MSVPALASFLQASLLEVFSDNLLWCAWALTFPPCKWSGTAAILDYAAGMLSLLRA